MLYYYQPTAVEEAYGLFLLQTEFQIIPSTSVFRIAGRQAVPFFCRSGIDRSVLRHMWSVVDPQVDGYLSTTAQFDTMLRLTALAQTGPLLPTLSQTPHAAPEDILRQCLLQTTSMMLPLPFFQGIVIPTTMDLQMIYQRAKGIVPQPPTTMPDVFAPTTVPLPPPSQITQQHALTSTKPEAFAPLPPSTVNQMAHSTQQAASSTSTIPDPFTPPPIDMTQATISQTSEVVVLPTSLELTSIDDAFSGLVQVEDKPLPSLFHEPEQKQTTEAGNDGTLNVVDDDDEDFGDFVDSASHQGSLGANSSQNYFVTTHPPVNPNVSAIFPNPAEDRSFFPTLDEPVTVDAMATTPQVALGAADSKDPIIRQGSYTETNPDTLGNFEMNAPSSTDDFGSFASSDLPQRIASLSHDGAKDEFGDHGDEWGTSTIGSNAASSIMSISDAFGGLVEVPDRPLPSIKPVDGIVDVDEVPSHVVEQQSQPILDESQAITTHAQSDVEVGTRFERTSPIASIQEGITEFAANPSSHEEIQNANFPSDADEDETEFGDFAGTDVTENFPAEKSDFTLGETTNVPGCLSAPSIPNGIFPGNGEIMESPNHADSSLSGWDALDALSGLKDTPLPPLETFTAKENEAPFRDSTTPNGFFEQVEDDDFVEFIGDLPEEIAGDKTEFFKQSVPHTLPDTSDSPKVFGAFAAMEGTVSDVNVDDKPEDDVVPSLSIVQPPAVSPDTTPVDESDFGDFASGDQLDGEKAQSSAPEASLFDVSTLSNQGDVSGVASELETCDSRQQAAFQQVGVGWDAFDALAGNPPDKSLEPLAVSDDTYAKHDVKAFEPLDERTQDVAVQLSSGAVEDVVSETDDFGEFSGVASGSPGQGFDEHSLAVNTTSSSGIQLSAALPAENFFATNRDVFSSHTGGTSDLFEHAAPVHTVAQLQSPSLDVAHEFAAKAEDFGDFSGFAANDRAGTTCSSFRHVWKRFIR